MHTRAKLYCIMHLYVRTRIRSLGWVGFSCGVEWLQNVESKLKKIKGTIDLRILFKFAGLQSIHDDEQSPHVFDLIEQRNLQHLEKFAELQLVDSPIVVFVHVLYSMCF